MNPLLSSELCSFTVFGLLGKYPYQNTFKIKHVSRKIWYLLDTNKNIKKYIMGIKKKKNVCVFWE